MQSRAYAVPVIIGINALIFFLLHAGFFTTEYFLENFLVSWSGLEEHRYWTLLTSVFTQQAIWHLLLNMFVLRSFGGLLEQLLGWRFFLAFYLVAGVMSSLSHAALSAFVLGQPDLPALGASGAIAGCVLLFSLMFPKEKILLFGIVPVPALVGALAFIGLDLWGLVSQARGGGLPIGHGAHLGGALTGIIAYLLFLRRPKVPAPPTASGPA